MEGTSNFNFGVDFGNDSLFDDDEIDQYIAGQKAKSTTSKEKSDLKTFMTFCASVGESRDLEIIPSVRLDKLLSNFFMKAVTKKGKLYEPDTLTSIRNSLQRILDSKGRKVDIRDGPNFKKSKETLASRRRELKKLGKGNKPNATRPLSDEEVNHLFNVGYFGTSDAVALQRTLWWIFLTKQFGHRARDEARQMKFGDLEISEEFPSRREYLIWVTERSSKTRTGEKPMGHNRKFDPKAFATRNERCPVAIFRKFISHRPSSANKPDQPLFFSG